MPKGLSRRMRRWWSLSSVERWLVARAFVDLIAVTIGLRLYGFQRLTADAQSAAADNGRIVEIDDVRRARHYARMIELVARHHVVRAHCLQRSLVLHRWLRQEGLPSELQIGVRKEDGALKAHAWVQLGGFVVNDRASVVTAFAALERVVTLPRLSKPQWY